MFKRFHFVRTAWSNDPKAERQTQDIIASSIGVAKAKLGRLVELKGELAMGRIEEWGWDSEAPGYGVKNPKPHKVCNEEVLSEVAGVWDKVLVIHPDDRTDVFTLPTFATSVTLQGLVRHYGHSDIFLNGVRVKTPGDVLDLIGGIVT